MNLGDKDMSQNEYYNYDDVYENILEVKENDYNVMSDDHNLLLSFIIGADLSFFDVGEHWHDWVEFVFVNEGSLEIFLSNERIVLQRGDFMMLPAYIVHSLKIDKSAIMTVLKISAAYLAVTYPWYNIANISCCSAKCEDEATLHKFQTLIEYYRNIVLLFKPKDEHDKLGFNAYLQLFLYDLYTHFKVDENHDSYDNTVYISSILTYIHEHYRDNIDQAEVADVFLITPQHLSRVFKKEMGITYKKYITNLRLTQASYELCNTNKSITTILYECGFPNQQSFIRDFKKKYGCLPKEYKKNYCLDSNQKSLSSS